MHISSWAALTEAAWGRRWHAGRFRTFTLHYAGCRKQRKAGERKQAHEAIARCGNSNPARYVFHLKRDMVVHRRAETLEILKKGFAAEPGCPNDHPQPGSPWRRGSNDVRLQLLGTCSGDLAHQLMTKAIGLLREPAGNATAARGY